MQQLLNYLLEVNIVLIFLYFAFWIIASQETFHRLNRVILLTVLMGAFTLPLVHFSGISVPVPDWLDFSIMSEQGIVSSEGLSTRMIRVDLNEELSQAPISDSHLPKERWLINPLTLLLGIYSLVTIFFLFRLFVQLFSLYRMIHSGRHYWDEGLIQVHLRDEISPFSFFHWVFFNPEQIQGDQRDMILEHERVHAMQYHNVDILLGELCVILLWFNPVAWKLKQAITQNLEFIADEEMLRKGVDRKGYQYSLLRLNAPLAKLSIANHFNYSLIKNRIHMMNIKKSPDHRLVRYTLFLPILFSLLLVSNISFAQSKVKEKPKKEAKEQAETKPEKDKLKEVKVKEKSNKVASVATELTVESPSTVKITGNSAVVVEGTKVSENSKGAAVVIEATSRDTSMVSAVTVVGRATVAEPVVTDISTVVVGRPAVVKAESIAGNQVVVGKAVGATDVYFGIPVKENENVFLVIRSDISQKMLDEINVILQEHGISTRFSDVQFDQNGQLTSIHVGVKVGDQYQGEMRGYNNGKPLEEPIVMYIMKDGVDKFGISKGIPGDLSGKTQTSLQKITGLLITQGDNNFIKGIYNSNRSQSGAQ